MAQIIKQRMAAEADGSFVLFLIGMRVNRWWKVWKWWPVATAMPRMIIELYKNPELGMLHAQTLFAFPNIVVTQYWRSFEDLEGYAKDKDRAHLPAWQAFNKSIGSDGDVGIWHETYLVKAGQYEAVYSGMPPHGLGRVSRLVPATGNREAARQRLSG